MIISLVNRKGGVTKTTSCAYIAMCLYKAGHNVTGVDTDPEKSWEKWHSSGSLPYSVIESTGEQLQEKIKTLKGYIVIDTPPNDGEILFQAGAVSDEIIIPLEATGLDVNRIASTLKSIATVEKMRGKPLASVLLTKWKGQQNISKEVETELNHANVPLLDSRIRDLTRYKSFNTPSYLEEYQNVLKELEIT